MEKKLRWAREQAEQNKFQKLRRDIDRLQMIES
jgi:hypothetical protein